MKKFILPVCRDRAGSRIPRRWAVWPIATVLLVASSSDGSPPELPAPTRTPLPVVTPAPKPSVTPKPAAEHRAPPGVLYLTEDTVVPLEHGLQGIAAGTEVKLVKENGDTVQVTTGDFRFTMRKTQVTDDLDIVAAVRRHAATLESADEASRRTQEALLVKQQHDEIEFLRTHPLATPTPTPKK